MHISCVYKDPLTFSDDTELTTKRMQMCDELASTSCFPFDLNNWIGPLIIVLWLTTWPTTDWSMALCLIRWAIFSIRAASSYWFWLLFDDLRNSHELALCNCWHSQLIWPHALSSVLLFAKYYLQRAWHDCRMNKALRLDLTYAAERWTRQILCLTCFWTLQLDPPPNVWSARRYCLTLTFRRMMDSQGVLLGLSLEDVFARPWWLSMMRPVLSYVVW